MPNNTLICFDEIKRNPNAMQKRWTTKKQNAKGDSQYYY